jgi:hypothetical protein
MAAKLVNNSTRCASLTLIVVCGPQTDPGEKRDPTATMANLRTALKDVLALRVPMTDRITTLDEDAMRLEDAARNAWASRYVIGREWTLWMRLSWASAVSETVALQHVEDWGTRLVKRIRGGAVFVGIHSDTSRRHAHALLYIPRGKAPSTKPPNPWLRGVALQWHQHHWRHGLIWLDRYSPSLSETRERHRAATYTARDPGGVMYFGPERVARSRG